MQGEFDRGAGGNRTQKSLQFIEVTGLNNIRDRLRETGIRQSVIGCAFRAVIGEIKYFIVRSQRPSTFFDETRITPTRIFSRQLFP